MPKLLPETDQPLTASTSVTKPVTTAVSAADVASPYMAMAHVLDKSGEGLNEFAMAQAKKAGEEAGLKARVDDNGQLVMDPAPFLVGPAMPEFRRAATMSALIRLQPQIETEMLKTRLANPYDPQAVQRGNTEYATKLVDSISDPALKVGAARVAAEAGAHNFRTSLVETDHKNVADAFKDYQDQIEQNNNQKELIARQGGGPTKENPQGSDEYRGRAGSNMQLVEELIGDKRFGFTRTQGDDLLKNSIDRDRIQGVIGEVVRKYKSKANIVEAQRELEDRFLTGPEARELGLGTAKREAAVAEGLRALERVSAGDREEISDNRRAVDAIVRKGSGNPNSVTEAQLQGMEKRSDDLNDLRSGHLIRAYRSIQDLLKYQWKAPEPERARLLDKYNQFMMPGVPGTGAAAPGVAVAPAPGGDYSAPGQIDRSSIAKELQEKPGLADRLSQMVRGEVGSNASPEVRRIQMETAMNRALARGHSLEQALWDTGAHPDKGYYPTMTFSRGGYSDEAFKGDLDAVLSGSNYAGKHSGGHLITGNASAGVASRQFGRGTPGFTLETGSGPESYFSEGPFKGTVAAPPEGKPIDFGNPAMIRMWEIAREELTKRIGEDAVREHAALKAKIDAGIAPSADEISLAFNNAAVSGKQALNEKIAPDIQALEAAGKIPTGARVAAISEARSLMPTAGPAEFRMLSVLQHSLQQSETKARDNPIDYAVEHYGAQPKGTLDFAKPPEALAGELATRQKTANTFQANEQTDRPIDVIGKEEAPRVAAALTNGDPKQAAQFLTIMRGNLSDPNYVETMSNPAIKDAVVSMTKGNDPTRFVAGMNAMATMWGTHHAEFESIYGADAANKLLAWDAQGRPQGGTTPADQELLKETMQRFNKPRTAAEVQSIKDDLDKIEDERKKMDPEDVAYLMQPHFMPYGTRFLGRMAGFLPDVPVSLEGNAAEVMRNEYFEMYKSVRLISPDADTAKTVALKRMSKTWGVSTVDNTLMKNNPEQFLPTVPAENGTYDWLKTTVNKHLESVLGPQYVEPSGIGGEEGAVVAGRQVPLVGPNPKWKLYKLVADDQTERERVAGKLPSYPIIYTDQNGQHKVLRDKDGTERWQFTEADRKAAEEELAYRYGKVFEREQTRLRTKIGEYQPSDVGQAQYPLIALPRTPPPRTPPAAPEPAAEPNPPAPPRIASETAPMPRASQYPPKVRYPSSGRAGNRYE